MEKATFGAGCFWGVEAAFRRLEGVTATRVGYSGGSRETPSYEEVCGGRTGHAEVVQVEYDPPEVSYEDLLDVFWDCHDPTTVNRQGPDIGTQYRSGVYTSSEAQALAAKSSLEMFQGVLDKARLGAITTEIVDIGQFYYAEDYHQQYLAKVPEGYCGLGGVGVRFPKD